MIQINKNKKQLIECLNIIKELVSEVDITFNINNIFIRAVHPSNHCMIILKIKSSLFEEYKIESEITYTLDTQILSKIIKSLSDKIISIFPEDDVLIFKDSSHEYKLNYFVGSKDERPEPAFEHKNKIKLTSLEFFNNISDCLTFDQIGNIQIEDNKMFMNSKSHMVKGKIEIVTEKIEGVNDIAFFDFLYIDMIKELKTLFKDISINIDNEFPLQIKCEDDNINFNFILANRIE